MSGVGPGIAWTTIENALQAWVVAATGLAGQSVIWAVQNDRRPAAPFVTLRLGLRRQGQDFLSYQNNFLTFSPLAVTAVNVSPANSLTVPNHGLKLADGPVQVTCSGTFPAPLSAATNYWAIPVDSNTLQLAATFLNAAQSPATPIAITSAGTGSIAVVSTSQTVRHGQELVKNASGMRRGVLSMQAFAASATGPTGPAAYMDAIMSALPFQVAALRVAGVGVLSFSDVTLTQETVASTVLEPRAVMSANLSFASNVAAFDTYIEYAQLDGTVSGTALPPQTVGT